MRERDREKDKDKDKDKSEFSPEKWTEEDKTFLVDNYHSMDDNELTKKLGMPKDDIKKMAKLLDLQKDGEAELDVFPGATEDDTLITDDEYMEEPEEHVSEIEEEPALDATAPIAPVTYDCRDTYCIGDRVYHEKWADTGVVESVGRSSGGTKTMTVVFDGKGRKELVMGFQRQQQ